MLMCIIVLDTSSTAYAQSRKQTIENIKILVKQANQEKKKDGSIVLIYQNMAEIPNHTYM